MSIDKIIEFAKTGDKNATDLDLERGFPLKLKPARQWWNYLFNLYALKINEIIDGKLDSDSNAASAAKLETVRTISLTGAVSGSGDFDGTENLSIETSLLVGLGVDQMTQNLTASRILGATYTNTTGKPIMVSIRVSINEEIVSTLTVDGKVVSQNYQAVDGATGFVHFTHVWVVCNNESYVANGGTLLGWSELR